MRSALVWVFVPLTAACAANARPHVDARPLAELAALRPANGFAPAPIAADAAAPSLDATLAPLAITPARALDGAPARTARAAPARDDNLIGTSYTELTLGAFEPAGDLSRNDTGFWGDVAFGRRIAALFAVEGRLGYFNSNGPVDVYGVPATLEGRVGIPILILEPYIGGGGGVVWMHSEISGFGNEDDFSGMWDAFAGVDVGLGGFNLGAEYRYLQTGDLDVPVGGSVQLEGSVFSITGSLPF